MNIIEQCGIVDKQKLTDDNLTNRRAYRINAQIMKLYAQARCGQIEHHSRLAIQISAARFHCPDTENDVSAVEHIIGL